MSVGPKTSVTMFFSDFSAFGALIAMPTRTAVMRKNVRTIVDGCLKSLCCEGPTAVM